MKKIFSLGKLVFPLCFVVLTILFTSCTKSDSPVKTPPPTGGGGPTGVDASVTFQKVDSVFLGGDMKFSYSITNCDYASYNGQQVPMSGVITVSAVNTPETVVTLKAKGTNGVVKDFSKSGYTYPERMGILCQTDPGKYWAIDSTYRTTSGGVFINTIPQAECWQKRPSIFKPYTGFAGEWMKDGWYDIPEVCSFGTGGYSFWGFNQDYTKMYWGSRASDGTPFYYTIESMQPHRVALSYPYLVNNVPDGTKTWVILKW
mgnify:CR=1 FL=1